MANHKRSLVIEGFPYYFGDTLSWHRGTPIYALDPTTQKPQPGRSVDLFGGVMTWDAMQFKVNDTDDRIADLFRFRRDDLMPVVSPNPLPSQLLDYDPASMQEVTVTDGTHPNALALVNSGSTGVTLRHGELFAGMDAYWSVDAVVYVGSASSQTMVVAARNTTASWIVQVVNGYLSCTVTNSAGTATTVTGVTLMTDGAWYHVVATQAGATLTIYLSGGIEGSSTSAVTPAPVSGLAPTICYLSAGSKASGMAACRIWDRDLDSQEVNDLSQGIPLVDKTGILYDLDLSRDYGDVLMDRGPYRLTVPLTKTASLTTSTRDYVVGDHVYLPLDTAVIGAATDHANSLIYLNRQVYSCLESGWWAWYTQPPYPGDVSGVDAFVCYFATDGPWFYSGRMIAYYVDDECVYIGRISNIQTDGRVWTIETTDLLQAFRDGFKPLLGGIRLTNDWTVGNHSISTTDAGAGTSNTRTYSGGDTGVAYDDLCTLLSPGSSEVLDFNLDWGYYQWAWDNPPAVTVSAGSMTDAALAAFCEDTANPMGLVQELSDGSIAGMRSLIPVPKYGVCGCRQIEIECDYPETLIGSWLKCGPYLLYVDDADNGNGTIDVSPYNASMESLTYTDALGSMYYRWGYSQPYPISLEGCAIVSASSLPALIFQLLTSTGTGYNGAYDTLGGWVGLGLPYDIVDLQSYFPYVSDIRIDMSEGKISDDLQAVGFALLWQNGKFRVKKVDTPIAALASQSVDDTMRATGGSPRIAWGHFAPVSSITYETATGSLTAVAWLHTMTQNDSRKAKQLKSACNMSFGATQRQAWFEVNYKRLQWLTNYAPVIDVQLPELSLELLDIVSLDLNSLPGQAGRYGVSDVPGVVIGVRGDWQYQIALNTSATAQMAGWCPSWEITSYSSTTVNTEVDIATEIAQRWTLPLACQIIDHAGAVLTASVNITAAQSSQCTLSAAPTYTQTTVRGILTLLDYTSEDSLDKISFVWAANTSGVMSDATAGKKLK